jgi:hypothetical protein
MTLPPHFQKIAADEARKRNAARSLTLRQLSAKNVRKCSDIEAHQARFMTWLFSRKG